MLKKALGKFFTRFKANKKERKEMSLITGFDNHSKSKSVIYSLDFKKLIKNNPKCITRFVDARKKILEGERKVKIGNVIVSPFWWVGGVASRLYVMKIGRKTFFIKEQKSGQQGPEFNQSYDLAEAQINALKKAHDVIAKSDLKKVKVAQPLFAWTHGTDSFLVTDFYNGSDLINLSKLSKAVNQRFLDASALLASQGFEDIGHHNVMVLENGTLVFFDLRFRS